MLWTNLFSVHTGNCKAAIAALEEKYEKKEKCCDEYGLYIAEKGTKIAELTGLNKALVKTVEEKTEKLDEQRKGMTHLRETIVKLEHANKQAAEEAMNAYANLVGDTKIIEQKLQRAIEENNNLKASITKRSKVCDGAQCRRQDRA